MSLQQQTICLAALVQHCRLVDQLARTGNVDFQEFASCLQQLFVSDHAEIDQAFGNKWLLTNGYQQLLALLNRSDDDNDQAVLQYAVAILHLERKLTAKPEMLQIIRTRLEHASYRNEHFSTDQHAVADNIAGIYQDTLSTLTYRIQVKGNSQHLKDEYTANRIRALLLCAVRATRLWRLAGGSRFRLIFGRAKIVDCCQTLLNGSDKNSN